MGDVINLRRARKQKRRAQRDVLGRENRFKFGRSKAARTQDAAELALTDRKLDGARLKPPDRS